MLLTRPSLSPACSVSLDHGQRSAPRQLGQLWKWPHDHLHGWAEAPQGTPALGTPWSGLAAHSPPSFPFSSETTGLLAHLEATVPQQPVTFEVWMDRLESGGGAARPGVTRTRTVKLLQPQGCVTGETQVHGFPTAPSAVPETCPSLLHGHSPACIASGPSGTQGLTAGEVLTLAPGSLIRREVFVSQQTCYSHSEDGALTPGSEGKVTVITQGFISREGDS